MSSIRVALLAQYPEQWGCLASVYSALLAMPDVEVRVVAMDSVDPHRDGIPSAFPYAQRFLQRESIPLVSAADYDPSGDDVAVLHNPYDDLRPTRFCFDELAAQTRVAYVPYGFEVVGGFVPRQQFNQPIHQHAWRVFARSERFRALFDHYCATGSANVVVTGHPKTDAVLAAPRLPAEQLLGRPLAGDGCVVAWNPHFSTRWMPSLGVDDWSAAGWSTFLRYRNTLLDWATAHPNDTLIIAPHPRLREATVMRGTMTEADWARFEQTTADLGNVIHFRNPNYASMFWLTDCLLSDASSLLFEYLPTLRPICYLEAPNNPGLNEEGVLVDALVQARDADDLTRFLADIRAGRDAGRALRQAAADEFLLALDGQAGARVAVAIVDGIRAER